MPSDERIEAAVTGECPSCDSETRYLTAINGEFAYITKEEVRPGMVAYMILAHDNDCPVLREAEHGYASPMN